ncbi:MAG: precorrin-3B C(17)-methyltransferase [Firmicutes bacterium]|nr:precorrin-3B C(17)-methyltransferase [Bacillota bacterium]
MSKLYVVGIGPGSYENMTVRAQEALKKSDILIGYTVYIDLVKEHFPDKEMLTTGMRKEVERCELALEKAAEGKDVAMICSGDAGVYGMSGLIEELAVKYEGVEVETIPGVSAVLSGAAILGAPLMHDFAVISLSDLMTPWEKIEKRLECAVAADFVICLYNPSSHKRHDYLQKACDLVLKYQSPETVCGIAKNIGREGECTQVLTLKELRDTEVDMFSTVFIGNSQTRKIGDKMVTPRGYTHE